MSHKNSMITALENQLLAAVKAQNWTAKVLIEARLDQLYAAN
ncbi:MAG TPA: hypothetical protein VHP58_05955 [Alphaproteobacteria bacterium]|nr:hypothetical protein [Alphaproteobacteria bacterium]